MGNIRIILKNSTSGTFTNQLVSKDFNKFRQKTIQNYLNFRIETKQNHVLHDVPIYWTWDCLQYNGEY